MNIRRLGFGGRLNVEQPQRREFDVPSSSMSRFPNPPQPHLGPNSTNSSLDDELLRNQYGLRCDRKNQSSHYNVQHQGSNLDASDFDWGDDDVDNDLIMASQVVEAAQAGSAGVRAHTGTVSSSPSNTDRIPLEMRRFELAMREDQGGDVRMEDIMPGGVLGGNIGFPKQESLEEKIQELEKTNAELRAQSYVSKGEATNLRRRLDQERKERREELLKRQLREDQLRRQEAQIKEESNKEVERAKTEVKFKNQEIRSLSAQVSALQKRLKSLSEAHALASQQTSASPSPSTPAGFPSTILSSASPNIGLNSSLLSLSGSKKPPGKPLSSLGLPCVVPSISQGVTQLSNLTCSAKESIDVDVQTESSSTSPKARCSAVGNEFQKISREKSTLCSAVSKAIRSQAAEYFNAAMHRLKDVHMIAEDEIVKTIADFGFPYSLLFPENVKLAECILARKTTAPKNPVVLPSQLQDWNSDVSTFNDIVVQHLILHEDLWSGMEYALKELSAIVTLMHQPRCINGLFRYKNLEYFVRILTWCVAAWRNFIPELCFFWTWNSTNNPRQQCIKDYASWTRATLWLCYRHLPVQAADTEVRRMSLQLLAALSSKTAVCCTKTNYFRIFHVIYDTFSREQHCTVENLVACLEIAAFIKRRPFYMQYFCRHRKDDTCLAYQFASKGLGIFRREKNFAKKFEIYEAYLNLIMELREYCTEHLNGDKKCEDSLLPDDPDLSTNSLTTNIEKEEDPEFTCIFEKIEKRAANPNATILSFYGSEEMEVTERDDEPQPSTSAAAKNRDQLKRNSVQQDSEGFKVPAAKITSFDSTKAYRTSVPSSLDVLQGHIGIKPVTANNSHSAETLRSTMFADPTDGFYTARKCVEGEDWNKQRQHSFETENLESDLSCTKLLDSSLWEKPAGAPTADVCQCRLYFMQAFLIMTETCSEIWRHLKLTENILPSGSKWEQGSWKANLGKLETKLSEMNKKSGPSNGNRRAAKKSEAKSYVQVAKLWNQRLQNEVVNEKKLTSMAISLSLETALEIIYDSYLACLNGVKDAFGKEGIRALYTLSLCLYNNMGDLNFKKESRERLAHLCEELNTGAGGSLSSIDTQPYQVPASFDSTIQRYNHNLNNPKKLLDEFEPENIKKPVEMTEEELLATYPKVVLQTLLGIEEKVNISCENNQLLNDEVGEMVWDVQDNDHLGSDTPNISDVSAPNSEFEYTSEESDTEEALDVFCERIGKKSSKPKPPRILGNILANRNPAHILVPDFDQFYGPPLEDPATTMNVNLDLPLERLVPKIDDNQYKKMMKSLLSKPKPPSRMLKQVAFKTISEAKDRLAENPNLTSEELHAPNVSTKVFSGLLATLNVPDYYNPDAATKLESTLNIDPLPLEI